MTRIRVRCADCGCPVVLADVDAYPPITCVNRLKPGSGACERDYEQERETYSRARSRR